MLYYGQSHIGDVEFQKPSMLVLVVLCCRVLTLIFLKLIIIASSPIAIQNIFLICEEWCSDGVIPVRTIIWCVKNVSIVLAQPRIHVHSLTRSLALLLKGDEYVYHASAMPVTQHPRTVQFNQRFNFAHHNGTTLKWASIRQTFISQTRTSHQTRKYSNPKCSANVLLVLTVI